jgi:putative oxidoreductase
MLSIFRIVAAAVFISVGTMKVFGYPPMPAGQPPIALMSQMGIGGMMEVVGGLLLLFGLFTRPVAFVLAGEMAVAYWQFHAPSSIFPTVNMVIPAILYCFFFLYLVFAGAGPWSLDARIARSRGNGGRYG